MHTPSVATLREGQRCRATGGRNPMDWVATFLWIEWQLCRGLGGNFPADWVAEFRGIRILQEGEGFTLLTCANTVSLGTPEIAALVTPVFYQDDRSNTFFVEPTFKE